MADLNIALYAKYWTSSQRGRIASRLVTWAQANGLTYTTIDIVQLTRPTRHEITFVGANKVTTFDQETFKTLVGA